ncbi:MAG: macro domain-containing protein [Planctomycetes bacterium]|nr:macro domain-containing protein [Planctomycetota bacterium]
MLTVHIEQGDLTTYKVDAIVNAANNDLQLGGGLAGAIARKGGRAIQVECDRHGPVEVGQAAITGAGNLPARHVIHQASMSLGGLATAKSLRDSTRAVLELAEKHRLATLAFSATGTGIAGFPIGQCAQIMLEEVRKHLAGKTCLTDVYFVLFDKATCDIFAKVHKEMFPDRKGQR